jgi:hypothetical protein
MADTAAASLLPSSVVLARDIPLTTKRLVDLIVL